MAQDSADQVIEAFQQLPAAEQAKASVAIRSVRALPDAPPQVVGILWLLVVGGFVVLMLGGALLVYLLIQDDKSTEVMAPLVTAAVGVLAGLLAPSPVQGSASGG
jgi:hypothetical protein